MVLNKKKSFFTETILATSLGQSNIPSSSIKKDDNLHKIPTSISTSNQTKNDYSKAMAITSTKTNLNENIIFFKWKNNISKLFNKFLPKQSPINDKNKLSKLQSDERRKVFLERIKPLKNIESHLVTRTFSLRHMKSFRILIFLMKVTITTITIYGSTQLGIWGNTKDSTNAAKTIINLLKGGDKTKVKNLIEFPFF